MTGPALPPGTKWAFPREPGEGPLLLRDGGARLAPEGGLGVGNIGDDAPAARSRFGEVHPGGHLGPHGPGGELPRRQIALRHRHRHVGEPALVGPSVVEDRRLHHHVVINTTGIDDLEEIRSLWQGGGYIRAEPLDVHYYRELAKYMTKEAREFGRPKPGERTWRASRNLQKPVVEYIEIPSDSVTLAPPYGAVDYEPFSEKNPYGYADCIGARYLLFPEREHIAYSYNQPRERKRNTP